ncbi:S4 domain-containing protein [Streptomyces sp. NPDC059861]|uniref:RNA-binding S4 domain-containing protein n=1 Tax=Streptomyces sp. NPDC059861 TaxID=3346974 RepID=UPI0036697F59
MASDRMDEAGSGGTSRYSPDRTAPPADERALETLRTRKAEAVRGTTGSSAPPAPTPSADAPQADDPAPAAEDQGAPAAGDQGADAPGTEHPGADDPKAAATAAAIAAAKAAGPANGESVRIDSWIWSVRLVKTRSQGAAACRGGHVRLNGERVKPAHAVRVGDEVRLRQEGWERVVVVKRLIRKRVGAPVAVECYIDNSPPRPPRDLLAPAGIRDRGTGRPTKRDRRELERLRGLGGLGGPAGPGGPGGSGGLGGAGGRGVPDGEGGPGGKGSPGGRGGSVGLGGPDGLGGLGGTGGLGGPGGGFGRPGGRGGRTGGR